MFTINPCIVIACGSYGNPLANTAFQARFAVWPSTFSVFTHNFYITVVIHVHALRVHTRDIEYPKDRVIQEVVHVWTERVHPQLAISIVRLSCYRPESTSRDAALQSQQRGITIQAALPCA